MHNEAVLVKAAFHAGASGFVTKSSDPSAVVNAIRSVARGERAMSDDIAHVLAEDSLSPTGSVLDQLGEREVEILRQFAGGATTETKTVLGIVFVAPPEKRNQVGACFSIHMPLRWSLGSVDAAYSLR